MASHRLHCLLFIVCFPAILFPPSLSPPVSAVIEDKVKLGVYYETLCPYSEGFILNHLYKIFDKGLIRFVDLKLVPYGNAKISSAGTILCQHGKWECILNTVQACAIDVWPNANDHFRFVYCVERRNSEGRSAEWESCFEKLNLDPKPVLDCYNSGRGHQLELKYGEETKALEPPHTFVPWWVVVNGRPLYHDYTNFIIYICKAYKGSIVPQTCIDLSASNDTAKPFNHEVCNKEEDDVKSKSTASETISSEMAY